MAGRDLGGVTVIRLDATIVVAHSDKQQAKGTFKGTWGHHPLTAWCDNTGESLAVMLRPGNAGSNTAADHVAIVDAAVAQIPAKHRRRMLFTCDGAGSTHALAEHVTRLGGRPGHQVHYSAGSGFDERIRAVLPRLPESAWTPALDASGAPRPDAQVAELTGLLRHSTGGDILTGWPADMRIIIRRENPHPGAQLTLFEQHEGKRYQVTATSTPRGQIQFPGARHRTQARAEDNIRCAKSTGLGHLPSADYQVNTAWCQAASIACDLLALATAPRPQRRPGQSRTKNVALQDPAHRRANRQRPAPPAPENPAVLALGTRHRRRVHPHPRPAATLTRTSRPRDSLGPPAGSGTGAHPARQPGRYPTPGNENSRSKNHPAELSGGDITPVNHRG